MTIDRTTGGQRLIAARYLELIGSARYQAFVHATAQLVATARRIGRSVNSGHDFENGINDPSGHQPEGNA